MQNSQTLTNLANSAKANLAEFKDTLTEIHKQSASSIEAELTKIYADEMRETKQNTKAQLEQISSSWQETKENIAQEIIQIKETMQKQISPSIFQSLWRGTTAIVALISFLAGGAVIYLVTSSDLQIHRTTIKSYQQEITELKKWQIPQNMQQSWQDEKTNKEQRALVINPKEMKKTKDGILFYYLNKTEL